MSLSRDSGFAQEIYNIAVIVNSVGVSGVCVTTVYRWIIKPKPEAPKIV